MLLILIYLIYEYIDYSIIFIKSYAGIDQDI